MWVRALPKGLRGKVNPRPAQKMAPTLKNANVQTRLNLLKLPKLHFNSQWMVWVVCKTWFPHYHRSKGDMAYWACQKSTKEFCQRNTGFWTTSIILKLQVWTMYVIWSWKLICVSWFPFCWNMFCHTMSLQCDLFYSCHMGVQGHLSPLQRFSVSPKIISNVLKLIQIWQFQYKIHIFAVLPSIFLFRFCPEFWCWCHYWF